MIKEIFQKLERTFALPGIIREYGVISCFRQGNHQCEVKAFLRKVGGQTILTLRHKNTQPCNTNIQYLDLDNEGIRKLSNLIDSLQKDGSANQPPERTG